MAKSENTPNIMAFPFDASFEDFLTTRTEQIISEQVLPDPEYRQYREEINRTAEIISGCLNENQKQYCYALDSAEGLSMNLSAIIIYKQGLKDGLRLRWLLGIDK